MSTALMIDYPELPAALTTEEHDLLHQCEQTIRDGLDTFYAVGHALATVNQQKLYRAEYSTFEAYCREKWQMGKAQAYRLIDADEVRENLSPIGDDIELPKKESHIRALKQAPAEMQADIWQGVQMSGEPVTATRIEEAVQNATRPLCVACHTRRALDGDDHCATCLVDEWKNKPQVIHIDENVEEPQEDHPLKCAYPGCGITISPGYEEVYQGKYYHAMCHHKITHTEELDAWGYHDEVEAIKTEQQDDLDVIVGCAYCEKEYRLSQVYGPEVDDPLICRECAIKAVHELVKHATPVNKEYDPSQKDVSGSYEWWYHHCKMDSWQLFYRLEKYREEQGQLQDENMKLKHTIRKLERKYELKSSKYEELQDLYLKLRAQTQAKHEI